MGRAGGRVGMEEKGELRALVKVTVQGLGPTKRLGFNFKIIELFPSPRLPPHQQGSLMITVD